MTFYSWNGSRYCLVVNCVFVFFVGERHTTKVSVQWLGGKPHISWRPEVGGCLSPVPSWCQQEGGGLDSSVRWQSYESMNMIIESCFTPVIDTSFYMSLLSLDKAFLPKIWYFFAKWHTSVYFWQIVIDISRSIHLCAALVQFSSPWVLK